MNDDHRSGISASPEPRLERWREWTDLPLLVLAFAVIPLLLVDFGAAKASEQWIERSYAVIWVCFVADFFIELVIVRDRRTYLRKEWPELLVNVLTIPLFLPSWLQVLRSTRLLRLVRGIRLGALTYRGGRRAVELPTGPNSQLSIAAIIFGTLIVLAAVLEFAVEGDASNTSETSIVSMGDALWWSVGTLTTIGYGDVVPHTAEGRLIAILPMIAAVGFVGVVAANLASRLFRGIQQRLGGATRTAEEALLERVMTKLEHLDERLDRIESRQR